MGPAPMTTTTRLMVTFNAGLSKLKNDLGVDRVPKGLLDRWPKGGRCAPENSWPGNDREGQVHFQRRVFLKIDSGTALMIPMIQRQNHGV